MKKVSVTSALKEVLKGLNLEAKGLVFADPRKPKGQKATGVKFCGLKITDSQKEKVISEMENRGFKFHYIRYNKRRLSHYYYTSGIYAGTRFCFSKIN